jgi:hypothetical protein
MAALRRRKIVATLLKLTRRARKRSSELTTGPGCTCESCVQAWDRHNPVTVSVVRSPARRRLRPGLD